MSNQEYYDYLRGCISTATTDLSGSTKGQLQAWLENAQFDTDTYRRKKPRLYDEETKRWFTLDVPPIPGKQSHAKGSAIPLVLPVEFATSSWRRAVMALASHQKGWLLYCYGASLDYQSQVEITSAIWGRFEATLRGRRVAAKTLARLRALCWLAVQQVKYGVNGVDHHYTGAKLAMMAEVSEPNWCKTYQPYWDAMIRLVGGFDHECLLAVAMKRSQQKEAFSQQGIAKVNKVGHI